MTKQDAFFKILFILTDPEDVMMHSDLSMEQIKKLQKDGRREMGMPVNTSTFKGVPRQEIDRHLDEWKKRETLRRLNMN